MAPLPLTGLPPRRSVRQLSPNPDSASQVARVIEELVAERSPYRRIGYPRAGGFDRLLIVALSQAAPGVLDLRLWIPGPGRVLGKCCSMSGRLLSLLAGQQTDVVNCVVLTAMSPAPGERKYGARNLSFARLEQGLFLEALHARLCTLGVENRLQGALDFHTIGSTLSLPWDMGELIGLIA